MNAHALPRSAAARRPGPQHDRTPPRPCLLAFPRLAVPGPLPALSALSADALPAAPDAAEFAAPCPRLVRRAVPAVGTLRPRPGGVEIPPM